MRSNHANRECKDCGRVKPIRKFDNGRSYKCDKCKNIKNRYGITGHQYYQMLEDQMGHCLICEGSVTEKTAYVDHDHYSGMVRGLLCHNCNAAIGLLRHNKAITERAVEYLVKFC